MSSTPFSVSLRPARRLRNRVKLFAVICAVAGAMLILKWPLPWWARVGALLVWLGFAFHELYRYSRLAAGIRAITVDQYGGVTLLDSRGSTAQSRLHAGTLVTGSLAWLRFRLPNGRLFGELLCKHAVQASDWHRLQLLWQQGRPFIGSAKRS